METLHMNLPLEQPTEEQSNKQLCCYRNSTPHVQVARISNIPNWYLEHVVFPEETFLFEAPTAANLEVYQGGNQMIHLVETISCDRLQVEEGNHLTVAV